MHPSDVEQYVAECVAVLRDRVAARRDLNVLEVALATPTDLHVRFIRSNVGVSAPGLVKDPVSGRAYLQPKVLPDLSRRRQEELVLHCDLVDYDTQPPTADLLDA